MSEALLPRYADRYFTVTDGLKLHYRDYPGGAGKPPLLCLPGLTRNSRDFADLAERCSPRFRVLALEFRGRAMSDYDPVPARYNPLTYAQDVIQLLDQLDIPQAIFVGTSLGGLVTMTVAASGAAAHRRGDPQRHRARDRGCGGRPDQVVRREGRALPKLG
jgi:pimeloyl-ACP methyl ester carboxylesterase